MGEGQYNQYGTGQKMEKFVQVKDIAEYLGVSEKTVYYWTHIQFIPHYRLPKAIRFKLSEIDNWILRRKRRGRDSVQLSV